MRNDTPGNRSCAWKDATIVVDKDFKSLAKIADRAVLLSKGTVVFNGAPAELAAQKELLERHLGV